MKKILILSLLFVGSFGLQGQTTSLTNKIDSLLGSQIMNGTPGGVICVVKNGKVLYKKIFGLANLDYRIPVTDSTVFNLASVSKQFTGFMILLLEKEGKLSLDDTIQKYIPQLKSYGHPLTLRELLHHTSGIPTSDVLQLFAGIPSEMPWNAEDEFSLIQSYHKLNFKPNDEFLYSNDGYFLLARVIEKVTGMPFSQCIREKIFGPLDMRTATIYDSPGKVIINRASGYKKVGEEFLKTNTEGDSNCGYSNVYASVNDMINWTVNLTSKSLGGEKLIDRLFHPTDTLNNGDTIKYTYGFFINNRNGLQQVYHEGGTNGFRAILTHFPESGLSVFVMANGETSDHWSLSSKISDFLLKDVLKPEKKKEHKEMNINKELFQLYKGSYLLSDGNVLNFNIVNDTFKLIIPDAPKFVMYPEKENEFFLKDFDAQCTFVKDSIGKVDEIVWHQSGQNFKGSRTTEPKPITQKELQSFSGKYEIPELNITYSIYEKDNELIMTLPKTFKVFNIYPSITLTHRSGDIFYGRLDKVEFKRNKEGKVTGFIIADVGRLRNIEFTKRD
jgi:CubicO group peptidase (beta-lactamase class C family)